MSFFHLQAAADLSFNCRCFTTIRASFPFFSIYVDDRLKQNLEYAIQGQFSSLYAQHLPPFVFISTACPNSSFAVRGVHLGASELQQKSAVLDGVLSWMPHLWLSAHAQLGVVSKFASLSTLYKLTSNKKFCQCYSIISLCTRYINLPEFEYVTRFKFFFQFIQFSYILQWYLQERNGSTHCMNSHMGNILTQVL